MGERIKVPAATADDLLVANSHTCCICREPRQPVEIHHINGNPRDNRSMNLAVLCRNCHGLVSSRGPLGRSYSASEVQQYKQQWETVCEEAAADEQDGIDEPEDDLYETKLLGANEHKFYRFEMDEWQELIGSIAADAYVDVVICEEADFEKWRDEEPDDEEEECPLPDHYFLAEDVGERTFRFTAPEGGVFGVLVINWGDEDVEVTTEIAIWE